jgi:hypothetical protein
MTAGFEAVGGLWEEGQRQLRATEPPDRAAMEQVVDAIVVDLRRRLGGVFTADELAHYYLTEGTDWCFNIATRVAPGTPAAWDMPTVAGAAFARYVRAASDFGGGRRRIEDDRPTE